MDDAIKKLEPYEVELTSVRQRTRKIKQLRKSLDIELQNRREDLLDAKALGASRPELAAAAGLSEIRVSQIIAGGAK